MLQQGWATSSCGSVTQERKKRGEEVGQVFDACVLKSPLTRMRGFQSPCKTSERPYEILSKPSEHSKCQKTLHLLVYSDT